MRLVYCCLFAAFASTAGLANAQNSATFSDLDQDGSGALSQSELEAVFGRRGASGLMRSDIDGDGELSLGEVVGRSVPDEQEQGDAEGNSASQPATSPARPARPNVDEERSDRGGESTGGGNGNGNSGGNGGSNSGSDADDDPGAGSDAPSGSNLANAGSIANGPTVG